MRDIDDIIRLLQLFYSCLDYEYITDRNGTEVRLKDLIDTVCDLLKDDGVAYRYELFLKGRKLGALAMKESILNAIQDIEEE